ncbi:ABC transporter B family member 20-like protein [Trifolium pratense]|uniref:ABC transporter B family member 20-like protein n=1 Tax=Trifolium pratense TaxID=57577 RepID=A0A2K3MQT6_TRIPR|nr:ABC transporter B family member 20-like protein [Trifolium pratense]
MAAMLRNEAGWFDDEENSADNLSMRLANDATFVRAAFSNRLSIFIQDSAAVPSQYHCTNPSEFAAVIVGLLIGVVLHWRLAPVDFATLPVDFP